MASLTEQVGFAVDRLARAPVILRGDASGRIVSCSQNLLNVGLRSEEVFGKSWRSLFSGFQKIPMAAPPDVEQFLLVHNDPDERAYSVVVHESLGANGEPDGEFVAIEAHAGQFIEELKEFEKIQCLGQMAAEFAHELNNTLTSVSGWLQILAQDFPVDDPRRESLNVVYGETRRTARTAASLLAMARGDAGAPHGPLDVNRLLEAVVALVEPSLSENAIELEKRLGEVPAVCGSEDELKQVFLNLLLNAAKAIQTGGCITVTTDKTSCGLVRTRVSDTGCGIQPEHIDKIFEAFYTNRPGGGGTGLGLYVSRRIVGRHNGELLVESAPGEGSTFTVVLPPADPPESG